MWVNLPRKHLNPGTRLEKSYNSTTSYFAISCQCASSPTTVVSYSVGMDAEILTDSLTSKQKHFKEFYD